MFKYANASRELSNLTFNDAAELNYIYLKGVVKEKKRRCTMNILNVEDGKEHWESYKKVPFFHLAL